MSVWTKIKHEWKKREAVRECNELRAARIADNAKAQTEYKKQLDVASLLLRHIAQSGEDVVKKELPRLGLPTPKYSVQPYVPPFKGLVGRPGEEDLTIKEVMAHDSMFSELTGASQVQLFTGMGFPGFPYLSELMEVTEYRDMSCRVAAEMCRKWISFRAEGKKGAYDKQIKIIQSEMKRLSARRFFLEAAEKDGWFGRHQLFMDLGETDGEQLTEPLLLNKYCVRPNSLRALKSVEPITTYPAEYNSSWPLRGDYYTPDAWWVYGQRVKAERMLTFVSRPLPDLLKPVFNFSGMSLSQLAQPYVDYWLNTRDSVGKLLRNFSCSVLKTNMESLLQGNSGSAMVARAQYFNTMRDTQGLLIVDTAESFEKHETSLSGLDKLQAQAQEHMAAVAKTPLTILLGITPTGLTNSDEQGLRIFYDYVNDQQERIFRPNLEMLINVIMLSKFGEVIPEITFDFVSLMTMTEKERGIIRKSDAESAQVYVTIGAVTNEEVRNKIAADPESGWNNLDVDDPDGKLLDPADMQGKGGKGGASGSMAAENAQEENATLSGSN